jgi:hypothetical protein
VILKNRIEPRAKAAAIAAMKIVAPVKSGGSRTSQRVTSGRPGS